MLVSVPPFPQAPHRPGYSVEGTTYLTLTPITHTREQVDGCSMDLTGTEFRDYHRRSCVCKQHMHDQEVMLNGSTMRFCHQVR
jgi:hypothetical protein